jgi:hypothetical protein
MVDDNLPHCCLVMDKAGSWNRSFGLAEKGIPDCFLGPGII